MNAFADLAIAAANRENPEPEKVVKKQATGLRHASQDFKRRVLLKCLDALERGLTIKEIAERLDISSGWLNKFAHTLPPSDPLRRKYTELRKGRKTDTAARSVVESVLDVIAEGKLHAKDACRSLSVPPDNFYGWVSTHTEDPLGQRYQELKKTMPTYRPPHPAAVRRAETVIGYMEKNGVNAKQACRDLDFLDKTFYAWISVHRDSELGRRYEQVKHGKKKQ